jgi:hypothetical protein
LLEFAEAAFDSIALSIEVFIVSSLHLAIAPGRNDGFGSCRLYVFDQGVGIVSLIGDDGLSLVCSEQGDGLGAVGNLSGGDKESQRQAQFVGQ